MRRYLEPAQVTEVDDDGNPRWFSAWGRDYLVVEVLQPWWIEDGAWWEKGNAGKTVEELQVRFHRVRAVGVRTAVVQMRQRGGEWTVVGVED